MLEALRNLPPRLTALEQIVLDALDERTALGLHEVAARLNLAGPSEPLQEHLYRLFVLGLVAHGPNGGFIRLRRERP